MSAVFLCPQEQALPLMTIAELRTCEIEAEAILPAHTLMARAGEAAAQWLCKQMSHAGSVVDTSNYPVWIAAGPGNNGGDALVMATHLKRAGIAVKVWMPFEVKPNDARWALAEARAARVPISVSPVTSFDGFGWLVDGMFGIGLARPLEGVFATIAERLAIHARIYGCVLALDLPSGLDSNTGSVIGDGIAVRATNTITFISAKPGLFMTTGRDCAGTVVIAPLGVETATVAVSTWLNAPSLFSAYLPARDFSTHKGTFGSLAVVGGETGMCGALVLAARAALFAGAGKVHVGFIGNSLPFYDLLHPELMLYSASDLSLDAMNAFAIGFGMGSSDRARNILHDVLKTSMPILIDADALNLVSRDETLAAQLTRRTITATPCVLTPHPLEAARLLGSNARTVQQNRLAAARALATRFSAVVVLKGNGTVIVATDGRCAINPTGNAALATSGTGDVLGGIIGALLAQRVPPYEAALAGVYLHGLAADILTDQGDGPAGLTASELAHMVRMLVNQLYGSFQPPQCLQHYN